MGASHTYRYISVPAKPTMPWLGMATIKTYKPSDSGRATHCSIADFEDNSYSEGRAASSSTGTIFTAGRFTIRSQWNGSNSYVAASIDCELWQISENNVVKIADLDANVQFTVSPGWDSGNPKIYFFK